MSLSIIKNQQGMTLVELIVATVIVAVGAVAVLWVFPAGWSSTTMADRIGQASEIMHREMEAAELNTMNPCNAVVTGTATPTVFAGGQLAAQQGDRAYFVTRTISDLGNNTWRVTVRVTWTGNATGIVDSIIVVRDENFRQGC